MKRKGWTNAHTKVKEINLKMIWKFYEKPSVIQLGWMLIGEFKIDGKKNSFTSRELDDDLGVPHEGRILYIKGKWPSEYKREDVLDEINDLIEIPCHLQKTLTTIL